MFAIRPIARRATPGVAVAAMLVSVGMRSVPQRQVLVDIDGLSPHETAVTGFVLTSAQDLQIQATGADYRYRLRGWNFGDGDRGWPGNAWILDARTREVVWELADADAERERGGFRTFAGTVRLPAGSYLAYYASYTGVRRFDNRRRRSDEWEDDGTAEDFRFVIEGTGSASSVSDVERAVAADAFVAFTGLGTDVDERVSFAIDRATDVDVYALGEAIDDETYDYSWITNTQTGEIVWSFDSWRAEHAGGAWKNRVERATIRLEPGTYAAFAVTDGSHDVEDWNAPPPYDPTNWGLTLRARDGRAIRTYAYERVPAANVIVDLTGMRDHESESMGFTLTRPMNVRVYALGEGIDGRMYDHGWIIDATTRERVWTMDYYDTEHGGGADKNRRADEVIRLDAGNYVVFYVTDGSHSYREWNSARPMDAESWGITVLAADGPPGDAVRPYDDADNPAIVAQLTGVGDRERRRRRFTLDRETTVRVYAIGEGSSGEMYDTAWIENAATRRVVWEMTYRRSDHAGGARKNRMVNETVTLPAGEYVLRYESDGSHSMDDWNADPPDDMFNYGVTVFRNAR